MLQYLNLDLSIEQREGHYRARVLDSPSGQAAGDFTLPFSPLELENFFLRIGRPRQARRQVRLSGPTERDYVREFGGKLYQAVFNDEMRACLRSSLDQANQQGKGLRIRLRLAEAPVLSDLPWEFLHNPALNRFLSLSVETPLVRYLDLPERIRPLAVQPPFRALVMISDPSDVAVLDVEQEWARLTGALRLLEERRLLVLDRLDRATLPALQSQLRRTDYHIFHYIGHGDYDPRTQDGVLLLEDDQGRGRPISGVDLGVALHDARALRLAVLNSCEGARTSATDPFAGTAQSLVQAGIPAVIAMQMEITDEVAITFAHEFYTALVDGYAVDAALAEARKAIYLQGNEIEWGTPVLHMRAPEGVLFDVAATDRAPDMGGPLQEKERPAQGVASAPAAAPAEAQPPPQRISPAAGRATEEQAAPSAPAQRQPGLAERFPFLRAWKFWSAIGGVLAAVILFLALRPAIWPPPATPTPPLSPTAAVARPTFTSRPTRAAATATQQPVIPTLLRATATPTRPARPIPATGPEDLVLAPGVTLQLMRIPAGKFTMGSADADSAAEADEKPPHTVYLDEYLIGMHEVTVAQFRAFAEANISYSYRTTAEREGSGFSLSNRKVSGADWQHPYGPDSDLRGKDDHPVTQVSWDDAVAFCDWASKVSGRLVRLPTEAEWEKAARGQDGRLYPWGNDTDPARANTKEGGPGDTAPVGSCPGGASPYGALDMAGNVWEWTADWYAAGYYLESPEGNPQGPAESQGQGKILRGGGWPNTQAAARCASRGYGDADHPSDYFGFRVVVEPEGARPAPTAAPKAISLSLGYEPGAIDPALASDPASMQVAELLFLGLTDYDDQTSSVLPELATAWGVSADGRVWTFEMRQDALWVQYDPATKTATRQSPVTAQDVVYGVRRAIDPATQSPWAYLDYIILNAEAINKGENSDLSSLGVRAVDDYTVEFTLVEPAGYFPGIAGMWFNRPQPQAAIEAGGAQWTEPGNLWTNGPYVLDAWQHQERMVFATNPLYYGMKEVDIARIDVRIIADASAALLAYRSGELDVAEVAASDLDDVRADPTLSRELHAAPGACTIYYGLNTTVRPFDDVRVRQAFSYAVDRQQLVDDVLLGQGMPAKGLGAPGILGSPAENDAFRGASFDPERARALMREAGYPDGIGGDITLAFYWSDANQKMAEFLQQSFKDNLAAEIRLVGQELREYMNALDGGDAPQLYRLGYCADYPDENSYLMTNLHTTRGRNRAKWSGPAAATFDQLVEQAAALYEPEKRAELYLEAEKLLIEDQAIIIPLYHERRMFCTKPWLQRTYALTGIEHIDRWKVLPH